MGNHKPLMTPKELFGSHCFKKNSALYDQLRRKFVLHCLQASTLYTCWGSLVFAVCKFLRHHVASLKENPCRSGSPLCKVRWKSLLWLTRPPCVPWYLELQWEFLLGVRILNADSHKLHLMGKAGKCSALDTKSDPSSPSSCDLEHVHLLWLSVFLNTVFSHFVSDTVSLRCPSSPRTSENSEKPDQHPKGYTKTRQVSSSSQPAGARFQGPFLMEGQPTSQGTHRAVSARPRARPLGLRAVGCLHEGSPHLDCSELSLIVSVWEELSLSWKLSWLPRFGEPSRKRTVGGESEFCRYLDKPVWRWDVWTWCRKSLFYCLYFLFNLFLISCALPLVHWVCCLITTVSTNYLSSSSVFFVLSLR